MMHMQFVLFLAGLLICPVAGQIKTTESVNSSIPYPVSGFQNNVELYNGNARKGNISFTFSWNLTTKNVPNDWLIALFTLKYSTADFPPLYAAIAFGESMLKAEFIFCHNNLDNYYHVNVPVNGIHEIKLHEHFTHFKYGKPVCLIDTGISKDQWRANTIGYSKLEGQAEKRHSTLLL
jgi:hypothetical protein